MINCSNKFKKISGYFHLLSVIIISVFTILQIYILEKGNKTEYWIPIAIIITIILHIPNIICIALNEWHAWYTIIASICALSLNSYLIYYLVKHQKKFNNS